MSAAVISFQALSEAIGTWLHEGTYDVHLYVNNYTPTGASQLANFTEASYDSYPSGGIVPALPSVVQVGNEFQFTTVGVNFPAPVADGPVSVYGFYVRYRSELTGNYFVLLSALFPGGPIVLTNGGSSLPFVINTSDLDVNNP